MERGRSLFISKVKFQGHWAFSKNSGTWILVGRIIKLSMYSSYGKRKKPNDFQGH